MEQAEHAALAIAQRKRQRFDQRTFQRQPKRGRVHFVFRQLEFSIAHIFIGEEFYFLEADDLRAHQHVAMGPHGARIGAAP